MKKTTAAIIGAGAGGAILARRLWKSAALNRKNRAIAGRPSIVILGSGFGGLTVARELARLLPAPENGEITLVDQNNYLLFTPMLTEVASGQLDPRHIVAAPRRLSPRIRFAQGRVHDIDLDNRSVVLRVGPDESGRRTLRADHLVIGLGSVPNYHHVPGLREHSLGIKTLAEATAIRNRILGSLERANWESDGEIRRALLTFVVGGGGYTGVETMAAINDLARSAARDYPNVRASEIRTMIVEPGDRLLAELTPQLAAFAQKELEKRRVEVLLKTKIVEASEGSVRLEGGRDIATRLLVWAGGVTPNPLIDSLNCRRGKHGGIVVDECCRAPGHSGVWALGDCAEVPKHGSQETYAPTAQNATREAEAVARNIVAVLRREQPQVFDFTPIGELALVGRHSGVARLYGYQFSGFLAWAMWRAIYLSKLPGWAQRSRTAIDWTLDAIFGRSVAEFPMDRPIGEPAPAAVPPAR